MEEGAVGGVSDIMTGKTEAGQRTTIDKNTPSIDLTQIKKIQQDILQWDILLPYQDTANLTHATLFLNILHNWQLYIV
jgi:hypothetical protein